MSQASHSSALPGPQDIHRSQLANGITLLHRANFYSPSVVIRGYFNAGSIFDSDEQLGLADFAAACLMRGTQNYTFEQLYEKLEDTGASLGFSAGTMTASFSGRALVEDLPLLFELLAEALCRPTFPTGEVEKRRTQLLTGLAIRAQDTADMASLAFDRIIFRDHPYQRPDDGHPETIRAITRDDLVNFQQRQYGPQGMVISIVGAVDANATRDQLEKTFGDWSNPTQQAAPGLPPVKQLDSITREVIRIPGKPQADLMIGATGPSRRDPLYLPASLANSVLGQFGMMGRIGDVVREQSGLAYYASSSLSAGNGPGSWEVSAGVNVENVEKASELILQEIRRFVSEGVTAEELQDSQDHFVGRLPLQLESNSGVANALLNMERFGLGLDHYLTYEERVRNVTTEQALQAAQTYLQPDRLAIVAAGSL